MKIKFNSDDDLPLEKALNMHNVVILLKSFFKKKSQPLLLSRVVTKMLI